MIAKRHQNRVEAECVQALPEFGSTEFCVEGHRDRVGRCCDDGQNRFGTIGECDTEPRIAPKSSTTQLCADCFDLAMELVVRKWLLPRCHERRTSWASLRMFPDNFADGGHPELRPTPEDRSAPRELTLEAVRRSSMLN